ncbi:MAG: YihY/virulence factor BrkB family protein [Clostridiaceae bacterium]
MIKEAYHFIKKIIDRYNGDEANVLASHMTYSWLSAFFPFLIFLLTLIGMTPIDKQTIINQLVLNLPSDAEKLVHTTVESIMANSNAGVLSFSVIISLWSASSGIKSIIHGLNKAYNVLECRKFIKLQGLAMLYTMLLATLIISSFILLVFGEKIGLYLYNSLNLSFNFYLVWSIIRILGMITAMIITFILVYKFSTCKNLSAKDVSYGAVFSTIGWILVSYLFSLYVENFANYSNIYGSIAGIFIMLTWLNLISTIILFGGELNAVIYYKKHPDEDVEVDCIAKFKKNNEAKKQKN